MPIVILLAVAVGGGAWWSGTRHHDFLRPPPVTRIESTRSQTTHSLPPVDHPADDAPKPAGTVQPVEPLPEPPSTPAVELNTPPTLALYREGPSVNAKDLLELSTALETKGEIQRALLAAERVIDSSKPDEDQMRTAIDAIRRLRPQVPDWNTEPAASFPITLHAGAGKSTAIRVEPLLRDLANEIERASAGILKITASVASGRDIPENVGQPLIAVWLAGPADGMPSTEVFSFKVLSPDTLRDDLASTLLQLLRGHIGRMSFLHIPESELDDSKPIDRLHSHVTRLVWLELGSRLNPTSE